MNATLLSPEVGAAVSAAHIADTKHEVEVLQKIMDDAKAVARGADLQLEALKDYMLAARNPGANSARRLLLIVSAQCASPREPIAAQCACSIYFLCAHASRRAARPLRAERANRVAVSASMFLQDVRKKVTEMRKKEAVLKTTAQNLSALWV